MEAAKGQVDTFGVLLGMVGCLAVLYPVVPGPVINYDKLLAKPAAFLVLLLIAMAIGKTIRHYTGAGLRVAAVTGIVASWYLVYSTLYAPLLQP
jgi:uncharacterized membrane protein